MRERWRLVADSGAAAAGFRVRAQRGLWGGVDADGRGACGGFAGMIVWKPGRRRGGRWVWRRRASLAEGLVVDVVDDGVDFEDVGDDGDAADSGVAGCVGKGMWAGKLRMRVGLGGGVSSDGVRSLRSLRGSLVERRPRSVNFFGVRSLAGL